MYELSKNVFQRHYKIHKQAEHYMNNCNDVLIHYGISGQKWGLRRFQNEDRTLTEEGKVRYRKEAKEERKAQKREEKEKKKAEKEASRPESSTWKSKEAGFLSDAELNRRNSRLQREQQYRNMTESKGMKFLKGLGKVANTIFVSSLVVAVSEFAKQNYASKINQGADWLNKNVDIMDLKVNKKQI